MIEDNVVNSTKHSIMGSQNGGRIKLVQLHSLTTDIQIEI